MDEPRTISKKAYNRLVIWLGILIALAVAFVSHGLADLCGVRLNPGSLGGFTILYILLARALAEKFLRGRGLTRRAILTEIHARSPFGPRAEIEPRETVEARLPGRMILFLMIGLPAMGLLLLVGSRSFDEEPWWRWLTIVAGSFMLVGFVANVLDYGKPQARVDADGVTGYPSHRALWRRFVPWSDVFSCEVQTFYDTFGKPILLRPVLKGCHGETLMKLSLAYTPMVEQERIVKAIKVRLPETEVDAWPA